MVAVPADAPVITPEAVMLATALLLVAHGVVVAAVPEPVSVLVAPTQTSAEPEMVGRALIVMVSVLEQPLLLVYVITDVPADTPVTTPEVEIVATPVDAETQALDVAAVPEPVNVVLAPIQAFVVPVIVGNAFTAIVTVSEYLMVEAASVAFLRYKVVVVIPAATSYVALFAVLISVNVAPLLVDCCHW